MFDFGDQVVFTNRVQGAVELWSTDGTIEGTGPTDLTLTDLSIGEVPEGETFFGFDLLALG